MEWKAGLSPDLASRALFYNLDLFKKYNIDLLRDSMSRDEVFDFLMGRSAMAVKDPSNLREAWEFVK